MARLPRSGQKCRRPGDGVCERTSHRNDVVGRTSRSRLTGLGAAGAMSSTGARATQKATYEAVGGQPCHRVTARDPSELTVNLLDL